MLYLEPGGFPPRGKHYYRQLTFTTQWLLPGFSEWIARRALFYFKNLDLSVFCDVFLRQAQEEMAWRIAKMIVNDVMQQAQCEQPSEKVTKVRGRKGCLSPSGWSQAVGGAELLPAFPVPPKPTLGAVQTGSVQYKEAKVGSVSACVWWCRNCWRHLCQFVCASVKVVLLHFLTLQTASLVKSVVCVVGSGLWFLI